MSNYRVVGRVAEPIGSSCRIEILSFKQNGKPVTNRVDIKSTFKPHGFVFAPKFFEKFSFDGNDLIEFNTIANPTVKGENLDTVLMDVTTGCKSAGFRVLHLSLNVMFNERSFNQPLLKQYVGEEIPHFYIKVGVFLYGPFKSTLYDVVPKTGTVVNKCNFTTKEFLFNDTQIILFEPEEVIDKVDCMTSQQLVLWLKEHIRNQQLDIDASQLRIALDAQDFQGLDIVRAQRLFESTQSIVLAREEINAVLSISPDFKKLYESAIAQMSNEIRQELIHPLEKENKQLQQSVTSLNAQIKKLKKEEEIYQSNVSQLHKDHAFFSSEKTRLIEDIKAHALVHDRSTVSTTLITYEVQVFSHTAEPYSGLEAFVHTVNDSVQTHENGKSRFVHKILYQFNSFKCFLCKDTRMPLQIARLSNNCKVLLQQVEPDWLKFESLYNNGLQHIWRSAHEHPEMLHFFILQDINMAAIECYGRPLLDLASGIRKKLPSTELPWPDNLWIFGVPLVIAEDNNFGLPLLEKTFEDWGAFPIVGKVAVNGDASSDKYLQLSQLHEHTLVIPSEINSYFFEK